MEGNRPAVLVVDDEEAICSLIVEELSAQGYVCNAAAGAYEALAKLKKYCFDIALLDIKLPEMSGIDLLRMIAKRWQMTSIIMVTAMNDLNLAVDAMKLGASDYIVKPFTVDRIDASISTVLKNRKPRCVVYSTIQSTGGVDHYRSVNDRSLNEINAIAYGIDAHLDWSDSHSKIVTNKTVELARQLGFPSEEIEKWAVARNELHSERDERIKSMVNKLERSAVAQVMFGLTRQVYQAQSIDEEQNLRRRQWQSS